MKYLLAPNRLYTYGFYDDKGQPIAIIEFEPSVNADDWKRLFATAPAMLAVLTEGIGIPDSADFASDLEIIARFLKAYHPLASNDLRVKAQAIRAATKSLEGIAAAKGE